jgi:hypothetical protein
LAGGAVAVVAGVIVGLGLFALLFWGFGVDPGFGGLMVLCFLGGTIPNTLHPKLTGHFRKRWPSADAKTP